MKLKFFVILLLIFLINISAFAETTIMNEAQKFLASDGTADDFFGKSVSISGDTAIVGAYGDDDNGFGSGSVYVYEKTNGIWKEEAKLIVSDGAPYDKFGCSVSISQNVAIIGAYFDDDNGDSSGSAYVFDLTRVDKMNILYWKTY